MPMRRFHCFVLLGCVAVGSTAVAAPPRVVVHKCTDRDGQVSFQQQPCPPQVVAQQLEVEGDIDPAKAQAARERVAANAAPPEAASTASGADPSAPDPARTMAAPRRPPPCPPTRENPGRIVVGNDPMSLAVARMIYNELPSETTLKNSGRWPRDCVR